MAHALDIGIEPIYYVTLLDDTRRASNTPSRCCTINALTS